jgi:DNA-binding NtrC family response regulator
MTPHPSVLLGLRDRHLRDRLDGWMSDWGFRTRFTDDADEVIDWLGQEFHAVSFIDSEMERPAGEAVWRTVRPAAARRVVLMARDRRRDLMFEALRFGVATVLPLPPEEAMVRAALVVASGFTTGPAAGAPRKTRRPGTREPPDTPEPPDTLSPSQRP